jgi:predicted TIM-barrel fold metal-dependent hydrolase
MAKPINKVIDVAAWTGNWPFLKLRYTELPDLKAKLQSLNVQQAFVAPIEAILEQDPIRANKELLAATLDDDFFSPVLVVDLSYANWQENVELAVKDGRVRILKLLPNYHMYEVNETNLEPLVKLTMQHRLIISIQMRVEDRRGMYPLMMVEDLDVVRVVKTVSYFPDQLFILSNPATGELGQVLNSVDNLYVELASVEHADVLNLLKDTYGLNQVLFGSHAPFFIPEAEIAKLKYTDVTQEDVEQVAYANAERLLAWCKA